MRAYIDGVLPMKQIVSIDDEEIRSCEEPITAIVCENPAELDTLHDFLLKNTNIDDCRTSLRSRDSRHIDETKNLQNTIDSLGKDRDEWMEKCLSGRHEIERVNIALDEMEASVCRHGTTIARQRRSLGEMSATIAERNAFIDVVSETDLATLLESLGAAPHQKPQQGLKPATSERWQSRLGTRNWGQTVSDRIRELVTIIEMNNKAIDGLKSMLANSRKHNNRQAKEIKDQNTTIDGLETTRRGLLVACDKRNTLLVAVLKDLKSGVARDWIENDLDIAMEEL